MPTVIRIISSVLGIVMAIASSFAFAEIITIDATVKDVDAKESTITITKSKKTNPKDIKLEVGKTAKIVVGGKDATLDAVKSGQKASVSYESELEVVTKIEIAGESNSPTPATTTKNDKGIRLVITLPKTGPGTLNVGRKSAIPLPKPEGDKVDFPLAPSATIVRRKGRIHTIEWDFAEVENLNDFPNSDGVRIDKGRGALVITPEAKGKGVFTAGVMSPNYAIGLPITISLDIDEMDAKAWLEFALSRQSDSGQFGHTDFNVTSIDGLGSLVKVSAKWDTKGEPMKQMIPEKVIKISPTSKTEFVRDERELRNRNKFRFRFALIGQSTSMSVSRFSVSGVVIPFYNVLFEKDAGKVTARRVGGNAANAGLMDGDVVTSINGHRVTSAEDANQRMVETEIGEACVVIVKRGNDAVTLRVQPN